MKQLVEVSNNTKYMSNDIFYSANSISPRVILSLKYDTKGFYHKLMITHPLRK